VNASHTATPVAVPRRVVQALRSKLARWPRSKWSQLVVVASPEGIRVTTRNELAVELRCDGLEQLAVEAVSKCIAAGSVLTLTIADSNDGAGVAFSVVSLARGR